jgi:hypothetical protein
MRTRTLLTLVVAGGLALGACGGNAGDSTSSGSGASGSAPTAAAGAHSGVVIRDRLVDAASTTMDAGSARISMKMSMAAPGQSDAQITADGLTDFATGDMQMTMDMGPLLSQLAPGQAGSADTSVELRLVDKVMYIKYPAVLAQGMGTEKPWLSMDLGAALGDLGLPQDSLGQFEQTDPTQYLQYLAAVSSDVTEVGHDKLRDVDTTHYHATIDLTKALDRVPADVAQRLGIDPDQLGKSFDQLRTQAGRDELPMDVWVDANGRLRRMRMEMGAASGGVHIDMEMYDYGVDVSVQAPPADEVTDLFSMLGGLGQYGAGEAKGASA